MSIPYQSSWDYGPKNSEFQDYFCGTAPREFEKKAPRSSSRWTVDYCADGAKEVELANHRKPIILDFGDATAIGRRSETTEPNLGECAG